MRWRRWQFYGETGILSCVMSELPTRLVVRNSIGQPR